jgi:hypothetical protein
MNYKKPISVELGDRGPEFLCGHGLVIDGGESDNLTIDEVCQDLRGINNAAIVRILFPQLRAVR